MDAPILFMFAFTLLIGFLVGYMAGFARALKKIAPTRRRDT